MKNKKLIILLCSLLIIAIIVIVILTIKLQKTSNPQGGEKPPKETIKEETINENGIMQMILNLNNTKHIFKIEDNNHQVSVYFDNEKLLNYTAEYYDGECLDFDVYQKIKGSDNKDYFVYALANWYNSVYRQYLFIMNDEGKIIYNIKDDSFGAAFTDYSSIISIPLDSLYGNTGMVKVDENSIKYLRFYNYTDGEDYSEYQENIIIINNNEVTIKPDNIIKVVVTGAN